MKVWLIDFEKFIKVNGLQPVTNANMFDMGNVPTVDGLFSTEIFGVTTKDRKETMAYIDLGGKFLNPKVYITLKRLNRNFEAVVYGTKKFSIQNGDLVPDENGGTGLKWLYKHWDELNFKKNNSKQRSERVDVINNNKKDIIFTSKFLVLPAFYRDVNLQSSDKNPRVPEINDIYARIIRNVKIIEDSNNMDFVIASVTGKIQESLVEIYNLLKEKIQGKNGYIRRYLLGKTVDYSSRVVITAAPYNANSVDDQVVDYYHTGVPLSHVCSQFTPFIIHWVTRFFKNEAENMSNSYQTVNPKGEVKIIKLDNPVAYYNSDYIEKHLDNFVHTPSVRFGPIELPVKEEELVKAGFPKNRKLYMGFAGRKVKGDIDSANKTEEKINRQLTWTDIFYQAAVDVTEDKHVWVTRYPILDYLGTYTSKISVLSTRDTVPMMVGGKLYKHYPNIDLTLNRSDLDSVFRDTVNIAPVHLPALGADHDGDQTTVKPVFSQEANEECERILHGKTNLLTVQGKGTCKIGNEGVQTLYSMTKFIS